MFCDKLIAGTLALSVALLGALLGGCSSGNDGSKDDTERTATYSSKNGSTEEVDRTVLPIAEPTLARYTELDARNAKAPPRFDAKPPKGAPNVVIVLIDDIG